jgi:hypothetical protein
MRTPDRLCMIIVPCACLMRDNRAHKVIKPRILQEDPYLNVRINVATQHRNQSDGNHALTSEFKEIIVGRDVVHPEGILPSLSRRPGHPVR